MITTGTITEISKTETGYLVVFKTGSDKVIRCSTNNVVGLSVGMHAAAGGDGTGEILQNAVLKEYDLYKDRITDPKYKTLWSQKKGFKLKTRKKKKYVIARRRFQELLDKKILTGDFESSYFGRFKSPDAFAYFILYRGTGMCGIKGKDYRDYADEIFAEKFVFFKGHVFMR